MLLVADVLRKLGIERPLQQGLGQLLKKAILPNNVLGGLIAVQLRVDQLRVDQVDCQRFSSSVLSDGRLHNLTCTLWRSESPVLRLR